MNIKLFKFIEGGSKKYVFRWTKKHYEFCMDNNIFLSHKGKKVYEERNFFLLSKGERVQTLIHFMARRLSLQHYKFLILPEKIMGYLHLTLKR